MAAVASWCLPQLGIFLDRFYQQTEHNESTITQARTLLHRCYDCLSHVSRLSQDRVSAMHKVSATHNLGLSHTSSLSCTSGLSHMSGLSYVSGLSHVSDLRHMMISPSQTGSARPVRGWPWLHQQALPCPGEPRLPPGTHPQTAQSSKAGHHWRGKTQSRCDQSHSAHTPSCGSPPPCTPDHLFTTHGAKTKVTRSHTAAYALDHCYPYQKNRAECSTFSLSLSVKVMGRFLYLYTRHWRVWWQCPQTPSYAAAPCPPPSSWNSRRRCGSVQQWHPALSWSQSSWCCLLASWCMQTNRQRHQA